MTGHVAVGCGDDAREGGTGFALEVAMIFSLTSSDIVFGCFPHGGWASLRVV